jgi:hypothetical protein
MMIEAGRRRTGIAGAVVLASVLNCATASAAAPAPYHVRLTVELAPDVPDPTATGFLGSLLSNRVDYWLSLRRERSDTLLGLELTGPGPGYRCQNAIEAIRRDGRVVSVRVHKAP